MKHDDKWMVDNFSNDRFQIDIGCNTDPFPFAIEYAEHINADIERQNANLQGQINRKNNQLQMLNARVDELEAALETSDMDAWLSRSGTDDVYTPHPLLADKEQ